MQLLSSPFQFIGEYLYGSIKSNLATAGLDFNAKEANFRLPIKINIPYSETKIKNLDGSARYLILENLDLSLSILDIFKFKRTINILTNLYQGNANINLSQALFNGSKLYVLANMENVEIASLLADKRFKGLISTKLDSAMPIIKGLVDFKDNIVANIKLRDGQYTGGDKLGGLFILPAASDIKLDLEITGDKSKYKVERLSFSSNLGTISGSAKFDLDSHYKYPEKAELNIKIDLTDLGVSNFYEYLKLASKTQSQPGHKSWNLMLKKDKNQLFPIVESNPL